jgi:hypothetical protein
MKLLRAFVCESMQASLWEDETKQYGAKYIITSSRPCEEINTQYFYRYDTMEGAINGYNTLEIVEKEKYYRSLTQEASHDNR